MYKSWTTDEIRSAQELVTIYDVIARYYPGQEPSKLPVSIHKNGQKFTDTKQAIGDVFDFIIRVTGVPKKEAMRIVLQMAGDNSNPFPNNNEDIEVAK